MLTGYSIQGIRGEITEKRKAGRPAFPLLDDIQHKQLFFAQNRPNQALRCPIFQMTASPPKSDDTLRLVEERLEFVEIISRLNEQFLDPSLIRKVGEKGWTHPWKYFDALRNYLLLTCFDLLGQPSEFKDFQSWLQSFNPTYLGCPGAEYDGEHCLR
jgi:hypothetical protein